MRKIKLTQGKFALVDDKDFEKLSKYKWCAYGKRGYTYYATWGGRIDMHRMILGLVKGDRKIVDHVNHNGLDNQRSNLRVVSHAENLRNRRGIQTNSKSGHTGVYWNKQTENWRVHIKVTNKQIHLGRFDDIKDAIAARKLGEDKYWVKEIDGIQRTSET